MILPRYAGSAPVIELGEVSEWLKEQPWKGCVGLALPWVRIPPSPVFGVMILTDRISSSRLSARDAGIPVQGHQSQIEKINPVVVIEVGAGGTRTVSVAEPLGGQEQQIFDAHMAIAAEVAEGLLGPDDEVAGSQGRNRIDKRIVEDHGNRSSFGYRGAVSIEGPDSRGGKESGAGEIEGPADGLRVMFV